MTPLRLLAAAALLAVGAAIAWWFWRGEAGRSAPVAAPPAETPAPPAAADPVLHPVPEPAADSAAQGQPDESFNDALRRLLGARPYESFLIPDALVRRLVITVDQLPRERVNSQLRPVRRTPGDFLVVEEGGRLLVSPANQDRYDEAMQALAALDLPLMAQLYFRYYPLFQQAYTDMGNGGRHFNDRLVEVIDHLLTTPEPPLVIELVRPRVYYEYADPNLESASAGRKLLLRLGAEHRETVKQALSSFRAEIADRNRGAEPPPAESLEPLP
ncbi:MAG TPA: DUF3014 domain-containing protein [Nevskiaceae bacterium]|nr:DUF3014 domain-containing protein [Nevskiaceae bacterium]